MPFNFQEKRNPADRAYLNKKNQEQQKYYGTAKPKKRKKYKQSDLIPKETMTYHKRKEMNERKAKIEAENIKF